jgi:hypothetical protein
LIITEANSRQPKNGRNTSRQDALPVTNHLTQRRKDAKEYRRWESLPETVEQELTEETENKSFRIFQDREHLSPLPLFSPVKITIGPGEQPKATVQFMYSDLPI